ncbi:ABC transporter permease subunit [Halosegnis marinus]|uniref:ABC transporter permease subunit n=1 Tax=Halosegnis marinus TaxID=3034023 RepID=A0ABD5ZNX9_9EURY|nr:ABC transporter permease subunit [Halosegnis sp. DT85]
MTDLDPDSVRAVARKDFEDALRSRALLVVGAAFVVFFVGAAALFANQLGGGTVQGRQITSNSFLRGLSGVTRLLVPLTGAVVAYAAVVGERESGSLKLLLALPHSRLDVVVGKLLGRGAVVAVPVLLGLLAAVPAFSLAGVPLRPGDYLLFAFLTVLVGLVFVAVGLGASAAADSSRRAVVATFVPFAVFALVWGQVANRLATVAANQLSLGTRTVFEVYFLLRAANPLGAYEMVASNVGSPPVQLSFFSPPSRRTYVQQFGELPVYLTDGAFVAILLLWIVVPVALGYLAFERADL